MTGREKKIRARAEKYHQLFGNDADVSIRIGDIRHLLDEVERLRAQIAEVRELLDDAFDPDSHDSADLYDAQGVNQAHRVAAGGFAPRGTATGEVE